MRAIQLKDYYTGVEAPEADRIRIQAKIDELQEKFNQCKMDGARASYGLSIMILKGQLPPVRS